MWQTDIERFVLQATPRFELASSDSTDICLDHIWQFYHEASMFGTGVHTLGGSRGQSQSFFVPYLSGIQLFSAVSSPEDSGASSRLYACEVDFWPARMHLLYEFFEHELPFNRKPLFDMVHQLAERERSAPGNASRFSHLRDATLSQLHPASWYAVAWYPVYRIPDAPLTARFLTFHSLSPAISSVGVPQLRADGASHAIAIHVVGLKWYNIQQERWFKVPQCGDAVYLMPHASKAAESTLQSNLSEMQDIAKQLARGIGLTVLGKHGEEPASINHPDFEFFDMRS